MENLYILPEQLILLSHIDVLDIMVDGLIKFMANLSMLMVLLIHILKNNLLEL